HTFLYTVEPWERKNMSGCGLRVSPIIPCLFGTRGTRGTAQTAPGGARPGSGLQQSHEFALGLGIPLDVALRHGQAGMAGEFLHVPETAPDLRDSACRTRNEGAASRVRRTPVHLERRIQPMEPQAHGRR